MSISDYNEITAICKKTHHAQPEFDDQCAVFAWARMQECIYPELKFLFSTLNGVKLPIQIAVKMKRAGMKKGPLDMFLLARRGKYVGLAIELKVGKNKPTPEQIEFINFLNAQGYYACAKWGQDEVRNTIISYLEGRL